MNADTVIDKLYEEGEASGGELEFLIENRSDAAAQRLFAFARKRALENFGDKIYIRGLIEISSFCKNDCLYCGIRRGNKKAQRYRLTKEEILECCREGHAIGFRTFVIQGGEDEFYSDDIMADIIASIRGEFPDCAIKLSLGEKTRESYRRYYGAGANRYPLRHETATPAHYAKLHPKELSLKNRLRCLNDLKEIGFQTGCGFMVGSPYQTTSDIARDLLFIKGFALQMAGIGPFIPHHDTLFADKPAGTAELTVFLLAIVRLMNPKILLPATTALGTVEEGGRERGILAGCNVVMPNLSPQSVRKKYMLYDNKLYSGAEAAEARAALERSMKGIGRRVVTERGDYKD